MANILDKIMHNGNEYDLPEWIPSWWTDWQFLGKVSGDTAWTDVNEVPSWWNNWDVLTNVSWTPTWQAPSGWIENDTTWTTSTVTGIWAWSEAEYWNITPSWTILYFTF